jgi:hypothetical protein
MLKLQRLLLSIGVEARQKVLAWPTRQRQGQAAIPRFSPERGVDGDPLPRNCRREVAMHIDYSSPRNERRDLGTEKLAGALGVETIDTVDDLRCRLRKSSLYLFGQKQMLFGQATLVEPNRARAPVVRQSDPGIAGFSRTQPDWIWLYRPISTCHAAHSQLDGLVPPQPHRKPPFVGGFRVLWHRSSSGERPASSLEDFSRVDPDVDDVAPGLVLRQPLASLSRRARGRRSSGSGARWW